MKIDCKRRACLVIVMSDKKTPAIKPFEPTRQALCEQVRLFKKRASEPQVRAVISALAHYAKDRDGHHD
jgi:hypothetical protein